MNTPDATAQLGTEVICQFFEDLEALGQPLPQLWTDAFEFMRDGLRGRHLHHDEVWAEGFLRISVLLAAAAFEGCVNYLAERVVQDGEAFGIRLTPFEVDCLNEKRRVLESGEVREKKQLYSTRERFLLLCRKLLFGKTPTEQLLAKLDASLRARDALVHPKPGKFVQLDEKAALGFFSAAIWLFSTWRARRAR